ncbi:MAG: trypsin-like peptidase domain-containing protein [Oscillospiraceae bacterium]|nr:trypsin-like peptidase domain-containing protein [Oscillospiraceae bacterium]
MSDNFFNTPDGDVQNNPNAVQPDTNNYMQVPQTVNNYQNMQPQNNMPEMNGFSYSYNYPNSNNPVEPPKKKKGIFKKVIAFAVCAGIISAGSIQCYKYIDQGELFNGFFSSALKNNDKDESSETRNEKTEAESKNTAANPEGKSWLQLAAREDGLTIPEAVDKVMPAVVGISSEFQVADAGYGNSWIFGGQYTQTQPATATGTGIVMTQDGYIITNAHVIKDNNYGLASGVSILLSDNTEYEATIKGYDEDTDIAVLKIDANNLTAAEFGNSDELQVGELVIAIGNPLGFELFGSVTCGIVSALNREITINDKNMNLIQTDAAINSGNSGGPLINSYGQVIGINSAKMSTNYSMGGASVEGLSFAIPMTQAQTIIDDLINFGYVTGRPQIGITVSDIDEYTASLYNMPMGVYVRSVTPNGAADIAGIQEGDIIIGVNGEAVTSSIELNKLKDEHNAGDTITLNISRNGKDMDIEVTLKEVTQGDTIFGNNEAVEN